MIFGLIFSILVQLFIGILVVYLLWPSGNAAPGTVFVKIFLGIGIGLGITSADLFLWLTAFGSAGQGFILSESFLCLCLITLFVYQAKKRKLITHRFKFLPVAKSKTYFIVAAAFYIALTCAVINVIITLIRFPHGSWDAWALWNLRARFLFGWGGDWTVALSTVISTSHPDYPLLVPLNVVRYWQYTGYETLISPGIVAILFVSAIIGLIVSSLSFLRSRSQGFLAGLILLTPPFFIGLASMEYADIPLSFFLLATLILLYLQSRVSNYNHNFLLLAGITSGFAAWTKNEGLLILVAVVATWSVINIWSKGLKYYIRQMPFFLIGLVPILLIIAYFKINLAPSNDLVASQGLKTILDKLLDFSRYTLILQAFIKQFINFDPWYLNPLYLLLLYPFCLGIDVEKSDKLCVITIVGILCFILAGYFLVYLTTPNDLNWHLNTSIDRLLMQLFPSFVFVYFLVVRAPENLKPIEEGISSQTVPSPTI